MKGMHPSFLELSDETKGVFSGVSVCHETVMCLNTNEKLRSLSFNERSFVLWYQREVEQKGLPPPVRFEIKSVSIDNYNQDSICGEILAMFDADILPDEEIF